MIEKECDLIEQLINMIYSHIKEETKYESRWLKVLGEIDRLLDVVSLDVVSENRDYEQALFEERLNKLGIILNEDYEVSIAFYEKLNKYLDLYETLRLTKEQTINLMERDLHNLHNKKPLTPDEFKRLQIEMQVANQKKRKENRNGF